MKIVTPKRVEFVQCLCEPKCDCILRNLFTIDDQVKLTVKGIDYALKDFGIGKIVEVNIDDKNGDVFYNVQFNHIIVKNLVSDELEIL
jgi:hypothetical protein